MRGFGLGYKVPALNRDLRGKLGVSPAVAAAVEEVHRRAGAAAYYAVYRDREVVIAHVADSSAAPRVDPLDVGFHQAAHALAFGKVMLASLAPAARREYLRERGLPVFTERTTTEGARLERDLARVATLGLGADIEEFQPGLACVAAPVVGADGTVTGAVSVSVPAASWSRTGRGWRRPSARARPGSRAPSPSRADPPGQPLIRSPSTHTLRRSCGVASANAFASASEGPSACRRPMASGVPGGG